jgi:hypothetical protein
MIRNRIVRRALVPFALAATAGTVALSGQVAGAQVNPRIAIYWMTPTEYFNACPKGPGSGVTDYNGGAGAGPSGMTLDCTKGSVTYPVVDGMN